MIEGRRITLTVFRPGIAGLAVLACLFLWAAPAGARELILILDSSKDAGEADPEWLALESGRLLFDLLTESTSSGLILAGKKPVVKARPAVKRSNKNIRTLFRRVARDRRRDPRADFSAAIQKALGLFKGKPGEAPTIIAVFGTASPKAPSESLLESLKVRKLKLQILQLTPGGLSSIWRKTAAMTGGMAIACDEADKLPRKLLDLYLCAFAPQQIPTDGFLFEVDRMSTKVAVIASQKGNDTVSLISPNNWRYGISKRRRMKGGEEVVFRKYGDFTSILIFNPSPGRWELHNSDRKQTVIITESRQSIGRLLPRRKLKDSETLTIAAYLSRDGDILKLPVATADIGISAELFDEQEAKIAAVPLVDGGEYPDLVAGDGVYTGFLELTGREGIQKLNVVARSNIFSRQVSDYIEISEGDWLSLIEPRPPLIEGRHTPVMVELSPELPLEGVKSVVARLGDGKPIELAVHPKHPNIFKGQVQKPVGVGRLSLKITKSGAINPLTGDTQSATYGFDVVPYNNAPEENFFGSKARYFRMKIYAAIALILFGAFIYLSLRIRRLFRPDDSEFEVVESEGLTPVIEQTPKPREMQGPKLKKRPKAARPKADTPKKAFMSDVSDRIGEVVNVYKTEAVKGDVDREELKHEDLDHDGDSSLVEGIGMDTPASKDLERLFSGSEKKVKRETPEVTEEDISRISGEAKAGREEIETITGNYGEKEEISIISGEAEADREEIETITGNYGEKEEISHITGGEKPEEEEALRFSDSSDDSAISDDFLEDMFDEQLKEGKDSSKDKE